MNLKPFHDARKSGLTHIGMVWYEASDFEAAMAVMTDRQNLFSNHADWLAAAIRNEDNIRSAGLIPVRAMIRADAFVSYCRAHGLHINAAGRDHFANWVAYKAKHGSEH